MKATLNGLGARRFFKTQDIDAAVIKKKKNVLTLKDLYF